MNKIFVTLPIAAALAASALAAADTSREPLYIYLYSRVTDHVNLAATEDRLHRLLPMVEKYRKAHSEAHVSATVLFTGAVSDALAARNSQTHIVDFVRDYIRRGIVEAGYEGIDEPTYEHRPVFDFTNAPTPEDRWLVREAAFEKFLGEARDPLTGAAVAGKTGGLKRMQEVFGNASCVMGMMLPANIQMGEIPSTVGIGEVRDPLATKQATKRLQPKTGALTELGGDAELVQALRREHINGIMSGLPDVNPAFIPGFSLGKEAYGRFMSPNPDAVPELYWQDDVLRLSEASGSVRIVHAYDGPEAMMAAVAKADRSRAHIIHVELASAQDYLQPAFIKGAEFPPLKYAYAHPDSPQLKPDALLPAAGVDAAYAKEDALLNWLVGEFFPADTGSRMVSNADLKEIVAPGTGFSISVPVLRGALADYLKMAGNNTNLPPVFKADGHYLSLANMFQLMADALTEFSRTGKLPASVKVIQVGGPVRLLTGHGPNVGETSIGAVVHVCAQIDGALHEESLAKVPTNAIPISLKVDQIEMNPAQFMRLMALALTAPSLSPDTKLQVKMLYAFNSPVLTFPKNRPMNDSGFGWTLKPVQLRAKMEQAAR